MRLFFHFLIATSLFVGGNADANGQDNTSVPRRVARQTLLMNAKNLTLTTTKGTTYYYLVTSELAPVLQLGDSLRIGSDCFSPNQVRSMRFRSLPPFLIDEDSTNYDKTRTADHALMGIRRNFQVGKWNSVVFPFDLTGEQILDAFGEEAQLASARGIREANETVVEFQTQNLHTTSVVLQANQHYLLRPSREADVEAGHNLYNFMKGGIPGPVYLIPNVSLKANQSPRLQSFSNEDGTHKVRLRGTYIKLDDSVVINRLVRNRRLEPGTYILDEEGRMLLTEDSTVVNAFRSWVENLSEDGAPLKFYIDGIGEYLTVVTDGIEEVNNEETKNEKWTMDSEEPAIYDLSGRKVKKEKLLRGLYIINGKKVAIKN